MNYQDWDEKYKDCGYVKDKGKNRTSKSTEDTKKRKTSPKEYELTYQLF